MNPSLENSTTGNAIAFKNDAFLVKLSSFDGKLQGRNQIVFRWDKLYMVGVIFPDWDRINDGLTYRKIYVRQQVTGLFCGYAPVIDAWKLVTQLEPRRGLRFFTFKEVENLKIALTN